jgi:hypothetical protein
MFKVEYKRMYETKKQWVEWTQLGEFYSLDEAKNAVYKKLVENTIHNPYYCEFLKIAHEDNVDVYTLNKCFLFQFRFPKIESPWHIGINYV